MVGPIDSAERASFALKVKVAFSLLVGLSAGTITLQADTALAVTAVAVLAGTVVGAVLIWFVIPGTGEVARDRGGRGG